MSAALQSQQVTRARSKSWHLFGAMHSTFQANHEKELFTDVGGAELNYNGEQRLT